MQSENRHDSSLCATEQAGSQTNEAKWEHPNNDFNQKQGQLNTDNPSLLSYVPLGFKWGSSYVDHGGLNKWVMKTLNAQKEAFTVIMKHKKAAGAEVTVELDENLIGGGGHALLDGVAAELADLRRSLVRSVPEEIEDVEDLKEKGLFVNHTSNDIENNEPC